ncbi:autotransporter outer membrane beta-barrel domain-containing protein [Puniceicoccus vermicola]|uniref:PEP-CTERM sorting domain-containing protein n=1 Tax=Puniceicoccus vermicola TaxID=388746 RepID=A0A7X1B0H1_9BACT|nr:hypothetical protein [Puniceicoccus vermicola]MBC2603368.1 hypothetical protein [Puniceicoccus vermicola]
MRIHFILCFCLSAFGLSVLSAQTDKVTTTPALLQQGFGPGGALLPRDGSNYCAPTSSANSVLWLNNNGYTRLYETPFASASDNEMNLVRALGGLMGTEAQGGTGSEGIAQGWETYLNLKGYGGFTVTGFEAGENISYADYDLKFLQNQNSGYNVVNFAYFWGATEDGIDKIFGGHATTLLKSDPLNDEIIINNPAPFTAGDNPETHPVQRIDFMGGTDVMAVDFSAEYGGRQVWGVAGFATVVAPDVNPEGSGTPTTWTISGDQVINTNGSYLTVEAPISGSGRLIKTDSGDADGTLVLKSGVGGLADPYTFTGGVLVDAGTLSVLSDAANPVGTGNAEISGGFLEFAPDGSGENLTLALAGDAGSTFSFTGGGGLVVDKGDHLSVELILGGNTDGTTSNFVRGEQGGLMLLPASGIAELGKSERIRVAGTGGNLPQMTNGIVNPHVVGADPTQSFDGSFLSYDGTRGFEAHTGTNTSGTPLGSMGATDVADVTTNQTVSGSQIIYALRVGDGVEVGGSGTLNVGSGTTGSSGGVILNGGRLANAETRFGQGQGVVYTSSRGGQIDSTITTADGVLYYGPGMVNVTAANTYSGGTLVQDGHLQVRNSSGSATGTEAVLISRNGVVSGDGSIAGSVEVEGIVVPGVFGTTGDLTPSTLTVGGDVFFATDSILDWTLVSLTDDSLGGAAGADWGFLSVGGALSFDEDSTLRLNFEGVAGPESGNAFWATQRLWSFISFGTLTGLDNLEIFGSKLEYGDFQLVEDSEDSVVQLAYVPNGGLVIPEPAAYPLIAAFLALAAVVSRRKRRE